MAGPLICYATDCANGLTLGELVLVVLIAVGITAAFVLLIRWLQGPNK